MYPSPRKESGQSEKKNCDCEQQRGQGLGLDDMASKCELPINVVNQNKPKLLTGLPKRDMARCRCYRLTCRRHSQPSANRQSLPHPGTDAERGKPTSLLTTGSTFVRSCDGDGGTGRWKKPRPPCNEMDRG